jgi:hypothetical protein
MSVSSLAGFSMKILASISSKRIFFGSVTIFGAILSGARVASGEFGTFEYPWAGSSGAILFDIGLASQELEKVEWFWKGFLGIFIATIEQIGKKISQILCLLFGFGMRMADDRPTGLCHRNFCESSPANEYLFPTYKNSKLWFKKTWFQFKKNWRISSYLNKKYTATIPIQCLPRKMPLLMTKCLIRW